MLTISIFPSFIPLLRGRMIPACEPDTPRPPAGISNSAAPRIEFFFIDLPKAGALQVMQGVFEDRQRFRDEHRAAAALRLFDAPCDQGLLGAAVAVRLCGGRGEEVAEAFKNRERGDRDRARPVERHVVKEAFLARGPRIFLPEGVAEVIARGPDVFDT